MKIGTLLLKLRKERRLSQAEVADRLGICQSTYCAWESDRSLPNARHYVNLALLFQMELKELTAPNLQAIPPPPGISGQQPVPPGDQTWHENLAATQKQLIFLQQQKIEQLETENSQLRQQIQHLEGKLGDGD
jgi:transcriptional regulator with XRE-family HTH domain